MRILIVFLLLAFGGSVLSWLVTDKLILTVLLFLSVISALFYLNKMDLFWKVYAYFFALTALFDCVGYLFVDYSVVDYLSIPVSIVSSIGVFFFAFKKSLGNRFLWGFVLLVNIVFLFLQREELLITDAEIAEWGIFGTALYILLLELVLAPLYLALLRYTLFSDHVWQDNVENYSKIDVL